jgi:hypothetical protein
MVDEKGIARHSEKLKSLCPVLAYAWTQLQKRYKLKMSLEDLPSRISTCEGNVSARECQGFRD